MQREGISGSLRTQLITTLKQVFGSNGKNQPMKFLAKSFLCLMFTISCADSDEKGEWTAVKMASLRCGKSATEMEWLRRLVQQAKSDPALNGDIYAGAYDGEVIFIHQPMIMSCLACVIYDCDGNRLDMVTLDHEKLRLNMEARNLIYSAH